jgi:Tfp pilus assembly protein PilV
VGFAEPVGALGAGGEESSGSVWIGRWAQRSRSERVDPPGNNDASCGTDTQATNTVVDIQARRGPLSFFANMKTAQKLLAGFLVVSMLMVGVGVLGISKLATAQANLQGMYRDSLQAIAWLGEVNNTSTATRLTTADFALTTSTTEMASLKATLPTLDASADANWAKHTATDMTGREKFRNDYNAAIADYRTVRDTKLMPLGENNQLAEFVALRNSTVTPLASRVATDLTEAAAVAGGCSRASPRPGSAERPHHPV